MFDDPSESWLPFTGVGGIAVVSGVICCLGLKLVGGAVLFGGLAATIGLSTDQTTFLVGGVGGLVLTVFVLSYLKSDTTTSDPWRLVRDMCPVSFKTDQIRF